MYKKKEIFWLFCVSLFFYFVYYFGFGIFDYIDFRKAAISSSAMPSSDAGRITMVREPCILDTPMPYPTTCAESCPLVTSVWGTLCTGYIELDTTSQKGTIFLTPNVGFMYRGGGKKPSPNMQYIYGGTDNSKPWVIGIPSMEATRTQKLVDAVKYVIALFK